VEPPRFEHIASILVVEQFSQEKLTKEIGADENPFSRCRVGRRTRDLVISG
jgi:hypothetical protein